MIQIKDVEIGSKFITLYFNSQKDMVTISANLFNLLRRLRSPIFGIQRKYFAHLPNDIKIFHCNKEATKGPHIHVLYTNKPTKEDLDTLSEQLQSRLVGATISSNATIEEM